MSEETTPAATSERVAYRVGDIVRVTGTIVGVNNSDSDWVNVEAYGAVFTVEPSGHPDLSPADASASSELSAVAREVEALAANYPEDVFPASSDSRDAVSGTAMRHAYETAALLIREHAGLAASREEANQ